MARKRIEKFYLCKISYFPQMFRGNGRSENDCFNFKTASVSYDCSTKILLALSFTIMREFLAEIQSPHTGVNDNRWFKFNHRLVVAE